MIGPDHAVEGACDAFWNALFQAIDGTLPQADSTDPDCVRIPSRRRPGRGLPPLASSRVPLPPRPTDRHEPNSAPTPNAGEGRRECAERLNPTSAGLGTPATPLSPACSLLPNEADTEHRGSSGGVVPRVPKWRGAGKPAVLLLPAPAGRTEWA